MRAPARNDTFLIRQALMSGSVDRLPFALRGQFEALQRRLYRQHLRREKRETKAQQYQTNGLNGRGAVARRLRQMEARP